MTFTYYRYELLRLWRNKPFFFFSLVFPMMLYVIFASTMGNNIVTIGSSSVELTLYYMIGMAGYGALMAALSGGARIATERSVGWNKQLRLSPLTPAKYIGAKSVTAYLMCCLSMLLIITAGLAFGARIDPASRWPATIGLILVGVLPFVLLGNALGQLLPGEAMGPVLGGGGALFAFLGGMWLPLTEGNLIDAIGHFVPSYWISRASIYAIDGVNWPLEAWMVIGTWTIASGLLALVAYRRDIARS